MNGWNDAVGLGILDPWVFPRARNGALTENSQRDRGEPKPAIAHRNSGDRPIKLGKVDL
ncbi:MAG: hypothetical protein ACRC8Y_18390 [Chroococcales cyanobacterium]